jgi:nitrate reductase (cytochrome), electron transfer subunit
MKRPLVLVSLGLALLVGCATTRIDDRDFSLRKGSVFEPATPVAFDFESGNAGKGLIAPAAGSGIPPMISHAIDEFVPITATTNNCLSCHDRPAAQGKPVAKGQASPAPADHYTRGADGRPRIAGSNYTCTACHAPQAGVAPLVGNTAR